MQSIVFFRSIIKVCILILAALLTAMAVVLKPAPVALAAGVVSTCDEAHLLTALSGGGSVTFTCSGTINLSSPITISNTTTINGAGQNVTISGNNSVTVFSINPSTTLNLQTITIANGKNTASAAQGGAIANNGTLNVTNSTFSGNHTSSSQSQGGAIYNASTGTLNITASTFLNNGVASQWCWGGAIYVAGGTVTITNGTFYGNTATCDSSPKGGAIYAAAGTVNVTQSTFSGNSASGSVNSSPDGGAIFVLAGSVTLRNTIVANNTPAGKNCGGSIVDGGGDLRWPASDTTCVGSFGNPLLAALANNGGTTQTMALQAGSAAIDQIASAGGCGVGITTDQRGVARPRPAGGLCDVGAFEYDPPAPAPAPAKPAEVPEADTLLLLGGGIGGLAARLRWEWKKRVR